MTSLITPNAPSSTSMISASMLASVDVDQKFKKIADDINALYNQLSPSKAMVASPDAQALEQQLFHALAAVKRLTSQVAMHLDRELRQKLFQQLDSLHDVQEWEPGDAPVREASFATFLKAILSIKPARRPGLGLSNTGNLIAAWTTERDRLTIEFQPNNRVRWVLARYRDTDEPARFAGQTHVSELVEGLAPHHPEHWFSHEENSNEPSQ
jgi:hypothetical protein